MYQSEFFLTGIHNRAEIFHPTVINVFKIFTDKNYYHYCDSEEKLFHPQKTIAFIRCTDGEGKIYLSEKKFKIKKNECIFLNFHDIEKYKSTSNFWEYRWVNFIADNTESEFEFNKIYQIPCCESEENAFCRLLKYGQSDIKNSNYISSLFLNYFYTVMIESKINEEEMQAKSNARMIDEMCSYINQKLYSKISIEEISSFFKISPRRLHQIFTDELDISPKKYILKKKMEEGYKLLVQTSMPINKIAYMLCFSSPYHFTNEFKKTFGQSPSEVRNMEQNFKRQK